MKSLLVALTICIMTACSKPDIAESYVYTLYRNIPSDPAFRVHVATFDANRGFPEMDELDNKRNCERAQPMFQSQPDWTNIKFWCEKGRFKK